MSQEKKHDLPAMPFYVGDWLKCPEVRSLPPDYRGLWFDLICFMWESPERGVMIKSNGKPYSDKEIIRMVGLDNQNSEIWLTHLIDNGVCSRRNDGAIYSKRMIKDEKIRQIRRETGSKGGNPNLLVNHIVNQEDNQIIENENENINENKDVIKSHIKVIKYDFNTVYSIYPKKLGKKEAERHFNNSVKTDKDYENIKKAIKNFLSSKIAKGDPKFIPHASTWFNNWQDWIDYEEPKSEEDIINDFNRKCLNK